MNSQVIVKLLCNFADVLCDNTNTSAKSAVEKFLKESDLVLWEHDKRTLINHLKTHEL